MIENLLNSCEKVLIMTDIMSKKERSIRMSLIRSKWTKPEKFLHNYLKGKKIHHKMHPRIKGSPDIILPRKKLAIFINGCFWHGCKTCYRMPKNNAAFWREKILANIKRDKNNKKTLREASWKVKTLWEHEIPRYTPKPALNNAIRDLEAT